MKTIREYLLEKQASALTKSLGGAMVKKINAPIKRVASPRLADLNKMPHSAKPKGQGFKPTIRPPKSSILEDATAPLRSDLVSASAGKRRGSFRDMARRVLGKSTPSV